ncbi:MAG TPA: IclR family transcriptional regulator, partial [Sphingomicrobium sp.]|nr:IclR family transcriptional regulator [Sphingomicrobium sp.]
MDFGVRSTAVALDILETVAFAPKEIGVSAIATELGLAKSAVFRHLQTLLDRGYVRRNSATSRYRLGVKLQLLAQLTADEDNLLAAAEGPMSDLRDEVGETIVLSALERSGVRVVATSIRNSMLEIGVRVGSLLPFASSAQGKTILAHLPREMADQLLDSVQGEKILRKLNRELSRARRQGWLESAGEVMPGVNAIAAPIFDASDSCIGAIAVVGLFA